MLSAVRHRPCRRAKRRSWRRSFPIRSSAAPAIPAPGCAVWPGPTWPGRRPPDCGDAGAKIALFRPIWRHFGRKGTLALHWPILYKRGLIGISARAKTLQPSATDDASDNTPRGHRHGRSQKKNIALAAWHAPLGRWTEEANLYRG